MGVNYCEGEHVWGPVFESGNVYCKHCGVLLGNINEEGKIPGTMEILDPRMNRRLTGIPSLDFPDANF